jgi:phosphopantetheinyl transferase (holo-ACP synthase)
MLGNDVVDLADPETRTRHPGFDARVFAEPERRAIETSGDPHATRQMLWAAKESAYKAARRRDPNTVFSPLRFEVDLGADGRGVVRHAGELFQVEVTRSGDCIHAIACCDTEPSRIQRGVANTTGRNASAAVRVLALADLSNTLGVPTDDLSIERRGRIPELCFRGALVGAPLTLSHHGRYAAYAALP